MLKKIFSPKKLISGHTQKNRAPEAKSMPFQKRLPFFLLVWPSLILLCWLGLFSSLTPSLPYFFFVCVCFPADNLVCRPCVFHLRVYYTKSNLCNLLCSKYFFSWTPASHMFEPLFGYKNPSLSLRRKINTNNSADRRVKKRVSFFSNWLSQIKKLSSFFMADVCVCVDEIEEDDFSGLKTPQREETAKCGCVWLVTYLSCHKLFSVQIRFNRFSFDFFFIFWRWIETEPEHNSCRIDSRRNILPTKRRRRKGSQSSLFWSFVLSSLHHSASHPLLDRFVPTLSYDCRLNPKWLSFHGY